MEEETGLNEIDGGLGERVCGEESNDLLARVLGPLKGSWK